MRKFIAWFSREDAKIKESQSSLCAFVKICAFA